MPSLELFRVWYPAVERRSSYPNQVDIMSPIRIDAHQHFWNLAKVDYPWLGPEAGPLYRTFEPAELVPQLKAAGIDKTVLVQSANNTEDTISMLTQAEDYDWIGAVVGWVPLLDPDRAGRLLERYTRHPKFRGVRHLIHNEPDPDWLIQPRVVEGLKVLASFGVPFDVVAVYPDHLKHVPAVMERVPGLTVIIDHLAKPPIKHKQMGGWADQMAAAARYPGVYAKVSGLNTAADWNAWTVDDLKPYIDFAVAAFGADRLMFGSDWPVCTLAGDYARVWQATIAALHGYSQAEVDAVFGETARRVYRI
ncbi:MAG: amidohydrolase family protein [Anaerolineae bacterium]|nr:amidohydrolase family protein [Thermoflexales bacterium]MDW8408210.1 amidohydrolase family protein [Anaerolineae bacterium]